MSQTSAADLYLYRLAASPPYRRTIYTVFTLTAILALCFRVGLGRTEQVLPWYASLLSLYGFGMAVFARDLRCRLVYACFGLLVAAAFTRGIASGWTRVVGLLEVAACLVSLAMFARLSREYGVEWSDAVLESKAPHKHAIQEESTDEQGALRRETRHSRHPGSERDDRPGSGKGEGGQTGG